MKTRLSLALIWLLLVNINLNNICISFSSRNDVFEQVESVSNSNIVPKCSHPKISLFNNIKGSKKQALIVHGFRFQLESIFDLQHEF